MIGKAGAYRVTGHEAWLVSSQAALAPPFGPGIAGGWLCRKLGVPRDGKADKGLHEAMRRDRRFEQIVPERFKVR
jgi:hypothetical protein